MKELDEFVKPLMETSYVLGPIDLCHEIILAEQDLSDEV